MQHEVAHGPSFALLKIQLGPGESLTAEAGSMVAQRGDVTMTTRLNAGGSGFFKKIIAFFIASLRKVIGGETMFINDFTTGAGAGEVMIAPALSGHVVHRRLDNERIILQTGAYLASGPGLSMKMRWGGLRGILAKEGIVFLEVAGTGDLFFNAYGGVQEVAVDGTFIVDNGHIVAFDGTLKFDIKRPGGGLMGLFASGEGLVCEFKGTGRVWIQSRNLGALVGWLLRLLPG